MGRRYQRLKNTAETTTAIIAGSGPSSHDQPAGSAGPKAGRRAG